MKKIVATYDYLDEHGNLLYQQVRYDPKDFRQRRPNGNGGWTWDLNGVRRVPYRLPELLSSPKQDWLLLVEGEKDVETVRTLGFDATTTGNAHSWKPEFAQYFAGRLVCLLPDGDKAGQGYAQAVIESLRGVATEVRLGQVPDDFKDITDYVDSRDAVDNQVLRADIVRMIDAAKPVGQDPGKRRPVVVCLADVESKTIDWLWYKRVPKAMLTLLTGDPDAGKTWVVMDAMARVTCGLPWPDQTIPENRAPLGSCVFLTAEDALEYTIKPRFERLGGDCRRLHVIKGTTCEVEGQRVLNIKEDLPIIREVLTKIPDVKVLVFDPVTAYLGATNAGKNTEVRSVLFPLSELAEEMGTAVICISHNNKNAQSKAIHRVLDSTAFVAAPRAVWAVAKDRDDPDRRLLLSVKMNIAKPAAGLAFRISDGKLVWEEGEVSVTADDALGLGDGEDGGRLADACEWLKATLTDGEVRSTALYEMAKKERFSDKTLDRAKAQLGVKAVHKGMGQGSFWVWQLPQGGHQCQR